MNLAFSLCLPALAVPAGEAKRLFVIKRGLLFPAVYLPEGKERFVSKKADSGENTQEQCQLHITAVLHFWTPDVLP